MATPIRQRITTIDEARGNIQQALQDIAKYRLYKNDKILDLLEADKKKGKLPAWLYWLIKTNESLFGGPKQAVAGFLATARQRAISAAIKEHPELAKEVFTFSDPTGTKQLSATGEELAKNPDNALNTVSGVIDSALMLTPAKSVGVVTKAIAKQTAKNALKQGIKHMHKQPGKTLAKAALPAAYITGATADLVSTPESPDNSFPENVPDESVPYVNPNLVSDKEGGDTSKPSNPPSTTSKVKSLTPSRYLRPAAGSLAGGSAGYFLSSLLTKNPWVRGISSLGGGLGGAYLSLDSKDRSTLNKAIKDLFIRK